MPNINTMTPSKYLKKEDVDPARLLTFRRFEKQNVARQNEAAEFRWVAFFDGEERGLVLNKTNLKRAAAAMGSENTDDWVGRQIVAYNDPDIEFGGELVGGIRLRAPKGKGAPAQSVPPPQPTQDEFDDSDIPF